MNWLMDESNVQTAGKDAIAVPFGSNIGIRQVPIAAQGAAVVVAHPDDETVGIGGILGLLEGIMVIHMSDGAPDNAAWAARHGFASVAAYRKARRAELDTALDIACVRPERRFSLSVPDQTVAFRLDDCAWRLARIFRREGVGIVFTHPYEGGHPDHDATAFAVHAASGMLAASGFPPPEIFEMAFYHLASGDWQYQEFVREPAAPEMVVTLSLEQREAKRRMLDAHASQTRMLAGFSVERERFRRAPDYDFTSLPNAGNLLYERYDWGMSGRRWLQLAAGAASFPAALPAA